MLSNACTYGLRAMVYLAAQRSGDYTAVRTIAEALDISPPFLSKVFGQLVQAGLVASYRGPSGGVRCARPPDTIALKEIVVAIDGARLFTECVLGLPGCGTERPCPVHEQWAQQRRQLEKMFGGTTLGHAAQTVQDGDRRLRDETPYSGAPGA